MRWPWTLDPPDMTKLCVDCEHFSDVGVWGPYCHGIKTGWNPVRGGEYRDVTPCWRARLENKCGPSGKLWEPIVKETPGE